MSEYDISQTKQYRIGHVLKSRFANTHCCHMCISDDEEFSYVEMIDGDGNRHFAYESEEKYLNFEKNFHNKRYTSFCEFFTTETLETETETGFGFKYYVRRDKSAYQVMPLNKLIEDLESLEGCTKLCDRVIHWGQYDKTVNYHMDETVTPC